MRASREIWSCRCGTREAAREARSARSVDPEYDAGWASVDAA